MGKKYTADTFEGAVTGTASGNVAKSGDTMTGTLTNTNGNTTTRINNLSGSSGAGMLSFQAQSNSINDKIVLSRSGSGGQQAAIKFEEGSGSYADNFIKFELNEPNSYSATEYLTLQHSSATSSNRYIKASQPVIAADGIYLGTTYKSSANHLDDYEEGVWTPSLYNTSGIGVNYNSQSAEYIKVGRIVHIKGYISIQTMGYNSSSGTFGMNVPFAVDTSNGTAYGIFQPTTNKFNTNGSTSNFKDTYNVKLKFEGAQASLQCKFEIPSSSYGGSTTDANGNFVPSGSGSNGATFAFSAVYTSQS